MKNTKIFLSSAALAALFSFKPAEVVTWNYDDAHARLGFSISHMMLSDVEGSFGNVDAIVTSTKTDFSDAGVEMTAQVNSVNTYNKQRDEHLLSPDYFDAAKYPVITFKSTSFKKVSGSTYTVTGNLSMHGVTKHVTLTAVARTGVNPMNNKTVTGFKVTGMVNRKDFGIAGGTPAAMIGEEVSIVANAEFVKQDGQ